MPFLIALPYLLIEALVFWLVATWIGVGWTLIAIFALMPLGIALAGIEMRRTGLAAAAQRLSPGRIAADYGLLTAGAILAALPGFTTSALSLLLIFPPTRALIRAGLAAKLQSMIVDLGVRSFEVTNSFRPDAGYGSFGGGAPGAGADGADGQEPHDPIVIDEEKIQEWTRDVRPEDFDGGPEADRK